jgi:hypothetical protein
MRMVSHCKTTLLVLALLSFMVSLSSASAANNTESSLGSPSVIFAAGKGGAGIDHRPQAGPMTQKGKGKGKKKKKPQHVTKCQDIEQTCGTPGDARWCSCKEGGSEKTVQCGCKGGGATGAPSTPQTPGRAF